MEWNFIFRIDYLKQQGEERDLKGLVFTSDDTPPDVQQILDFLNNAGYPNLQIKDKEQLIFADNDSANPLEVRITQLNTNRDDYADNDRMLRLLAEQFQKKHYSI